MKRTSSQGFDELVKIDFYNMSEKSPKLLSPTWGGANSEQGVGPRGGANDVAALGQHKIALILKRLPARLEMGAENYAHKTLISTPH